MGEMLGTVEVLRRYPVKGLLGEEIAAGEVAATGLTGDRSLALLDAETGKVASPKNPRVWRGMLALSAVIDSGGVRVSLPDGESVRAGDPHVDEVLSRALGRKVTLTSTPPEKAALERAVPEEVLSEGVTARVTVQESVLGAGSPPGTFFDYAPLHLVTTSAIAAAGVEAVRYRPNLVIRTAGEGYVENGWAGAEVAVGEEVVLRVTVPTPRCAVPTLEHGALPRDTSALRTPAAHNLVEPLPGYGPRPCVGVYAEVLRPGRITSGDQVRLLD
ncbi:MOSC domain-containing protein [Nonomuraea dietziae]|uniref:MOSC domain-containing protein n=1 Tax=Nonomuraea dietziae TaxID=65515 RepID=UPI0033D2BEC3